MPDLHAQHFFFVRCSSGAVGVDVSVDVDDDDDDDDDGLAQEDEICEEEEDIAGNPSVEDRGLPRLA